MLGISARNIDTLVEFDELVDAMEKAFTIYNSGEFLMPDRMHVHKDQNTLLLMPCFADQSFCTKLVSVYPGNTSLNKPVIQGTVVFNDIKTGEPIALLNGPKLTAMRTAAVGSLGVRYLSAENAETLGIVGAGVQAFHQTLFACSQRSIKRILVYGRSQPAIDRFMKDIKDNLPKVAVVQAKSNNQLLEESQIIITATTSKEPVLPDNKKLYQDKCIIGVGSFKPEMMEFPPALFQSVQQIFIDTDFAKKECGDLAIPLKNNWITDNQVIPISDLVTGKIELEPSSTTCFKSVGMALFDLIAAELIVNKAIKQGIGTQIEL